MNIYIYIYIYMYIHKYQSIHIPQICLMKQEILKVHRLQNQTYMFFYLLLQGWRPVQPFGNLMRVSIAGCRCLWVRRKAEIGLARVANIIWVQMSYLKVWRHVPSCPSRPRRRRRQPLSVRPSHRPSRHRRPSSVRHLSIHASASVPSKAGHNMSK